MSWKLKRNGERREIIKEFFFIIAVFVIVVSLLLFYVWERATAMQLTLILNKTEEKLEDIQDRIDKIRLEYLELTSVTRIERIAKEELNMRYPTSKEMKYFILRDSQGSAP
jgi:cell division protein FtsL